MFLTFHISHTQLNLQRETSNMIAISLRDTTGVKHAEDYIKLSVADSQLIYPTKVSTIRGVCVCGINNMSAQGPSLLGAICK